MIDKLDALKEKINRINKEKEEKDKAARLAAEEEDEKIRTKRSKIFPMFLNDVKSLSHYTEGIYAKPVLPLPEGFTLCNSETGETTPLCIKFSRLNLEEYPMPIESVSILALHGSWPQKFQYYDKITFSYKVDYSCYVTDNGFLVLNVQVSEQEKLSSTDFLKIQKHRICLKEIMEELIDNWETKYRDEAIKFIEQKMEEYISDYERE